MDEENRLPLKEIEAQGVQIFAGEIYWTTRSNRAGAPPSGLSVTVISGRG